MNTRDIMAIILYHVLMKTDVHNYNKLIQSIPEIERTARDVISYVYTEMNRDENSFQKKLWNAFVLAGAEKLSIDEAIQLTIENIIDLYKERFKKKS